ncbi:MAG: prolyl oligopeptidase family serine peptidase [Victivallales bacterium]|nr:prolyl oligopeptidase family serine peptidase [Victivallales bacterium]
MMKKFVLLLLLSLGVGSVVAGEREITFTSSYDRSTQPAVVYLPDRMPQNTKLPLLVVAHYMGGNRFTVRQQGYYRECENRQWLLISPELHGKKTAGPTSCAALPAQHDILDSIAYMKKHYAVDAHRIYIAGRSMGGMMTEMMIAKYPDLFAAGVAGQGISNMLSMTTTPGITKCVMDECGDPQQNRFDYQRRSAVNYAPNFQYAPLIIWHGTNDTWVPTAQSEELFNAIVKYNRFQLPVYYLTGACHCEGNYTAAWICDQLQYYRNQGEVDTDVFTRFFPELELVTDEAKSFFWLFLEPADKGRFARIRARIGADGKLDVRSENLARIVVNLDLLAKGTKITGYRLHTDGDTVLSFKRGDKAVTDIAGDTTRGAF